MSTTRRIEIFSAGCSFCDDVVEMIREMACPSCAIEVRDVHDESTAERAANLGVRSVPAVAVDGELASCCADRGVSEEALRDAGVGVPID